MPNEMFFFSEMIKYINSKAGCSLPVYMGKHARLFYFEMKFTINSLCK